MLLSINQESNTFLVGIGSTGKSKTKSVTIGLARALAYDLELPQAPVEDPHMYYRSEHLQTVSTLVGRIMEVCLLDTDAVMKEVMSFYLFRYQSCYDNSMFHSQSGTSNGIVDIFKLYKHFSEETLCFMKDNATEVSVMNNGFKKVLEQLSKKVG
jgi:hypothetical protein